MCNIKKPFRLEPIPYDPKANRVKKILITKNSYGAKVKVEGWQNYQDAEPIDNNYRSNNGIRLHLSHYNRLGSCNEEEWATTTEEALSKTQSLKHEFVVYPQKTMLNFHSSLTYNEGLDEARVCSGGNDYLTTMQYSYQPPYPYDFKKFSFSKRQFCENRRLSPKCEGKFLDDNYKDQVRKFQECKIKRHVSFDPFTCRYTDGSSSVKESGRKCTELNF